MCIRDRYLLRTFDPEFRRVLGYPVRKLIEVDPGRLVPGPLSPNRRVRRASGTPNFVLVTDEIAASVFEFDGKGRDRIVPDRPHEDGAQAGLPEILARQN